MGKNILVVDNDQFILEFMQDLLTDQGHEVSTAPDGLSALEILKASAPDIVFVDLIMPNISGDKLCRIIRRTPHLKDVYLVVLSATVADEPGHFSDLGADNCIAKGPLEKMSASILDAVNQSDQKPPPRPDPIPPDSQPVARRGITRELLAVQRHLQTILDNISEGILELNDEGKVIFANNIALYLFGGLEEKILGRHFSELFKGKDQKKIHDLLENIGTGGPELIDPFTLTVNGHTVSLKILPFEEDLVWSVIVIAVPVRST